MRAAIDIGTNSILLAVGEPGRAVLDLSRVVGLGRGLAATGRIAPDRIAAGEAAIRAYREAARGAGVPPDHLAVVATAIARRAANWAEAARRFEAAAGVPVRVLSGEEEARLTWHGALGDVEDGVEAAVVDLGGGSVEVAAGRAGAPPERAVSVPLGAVTLTESVAPPDEGAAGPAVLARLREAVRRRLGDLSGFDPPAVAVGVGGTITTLAAMHLGLDRWSAERVHGLLLDGPTLDAWAERLAGMTRDERRRAARASPERADLVLAGTVILDEVRRALGAPALRVSTGGLRHALLAPPDRHAQFAAPPP